MIDTIEINERIAKCEKILENNPQSQIFAALADAYRKKGDIKKAQDICYEGLKIHPDYHSARIVMAKILIAKGNYDAASEELKKAVFAAGRTRTIDILEAEILIHRGRKNEASALIESLASADPDDENIRNLKELYNKENKTSSVIKVETAEVEDFGVNQITIEDTPSPPPASQAKDKKEMSMSKAVSVLKIMPRVLGVLTVGYDGMLLEGRLDGQLAKDEIAALTRGIYDTVLAGAGKIGYKKISEILIEMPAAKIWIFTREKYLLVVLTRDDVSLGALKLRIEDLFQNIVCHGSEAVLK